MPLKYGFNAFKNHSRLSIKETLECRNLRELDGKKPSTKKLMHVH